MRSDRSDSQALDLGGLRPDMLLGKVITVRDARALMMFGVMMAEEIFEEIRGKAISKSDRDEIGLVVAKKLDETVSELGFEADGDLARSIFRNAFVEAFAEFRKAAIRGLN